jgi:endonuclease/exonuclease/phosphatase family metal-dependent hydrolase
MKPRAIRPLLLATLFAVALASACHRGRGAPSGPLSVRVMTFNLRWDGFDDRRNAWEFRRDIVYRVLNESRPDSVGTQEPMRRQVADIEAAIPTLSGYEFVNDPKYVRTQQILYRNDRLDRVEADGFLLAEGTNQGGTVRYCTWVRLRDRATGRHYYHYNVHLDHRHADSRQRSAVRLMKHIAARAHSDPFVVTGDFNTAEGSPTMKFLRGERTLPDAQGMEYANPIPLTDTFRLLHPGAPDSGTAGGFRGRRGRSKIDHVLVQAGAAKVREAQIIHTNVDGRYPSDHFPVTAVIEWP